MMAFKSCSQQTEESYQLQLALALRLSSQAALVNDPNFLESKSVDSSLSTSPQALSYRFWVSGSLSYFDTIPDGFYVIHGLDPYVWTISTERGTGRPPSLESLHAIDIHDGLSVKVILVNRFGDPGLKGLLDRVALLFGDWIATEDVIDQLANIVCAHLGGIATAEDEAFVQHWKDCSEVTTSHLGSIVLPIGSISVGLCVHRALLFKVLADSINLPCRIVKGCKYCGKDAASSCLVQTENVKEYLVDLFAKPGALAHPDSSLNYAPSRVVSSPLSYPRFKPIPTREDIKMLAKLYFLDFQNLNFSYDDTGAGNQEYKIGSSANKSKKNAVPIISKKHNFTISSPQRVAQNAILKKDILVAGSSSALVDINNRHLNEGLMPQNFIISTGQRDAHPSPGTSNNLPFVRTEQSVSSQLHLEEEDLDILWTELVLKEKIGAGSFGTVHRAEWRGTEVAVKILLEQDFAAEHIKKFLSEIAIMRRLRHPNIVLFMGAVTQPPNLSIVTEYLSRGSLHKLLHKSNDGYHLDKRRRLNMAYDVAKGMSYLHQLRPPIVHRDLKSPNLLVDSTYTVKVCDFGLSRVKANTYLSSKTNNPGTPEWMAPEVLRNELSNEKSDVYSFGVILWELVTLQQPWRNLSRAQVVAAVGFMGQRLEIPSNVNPSLGVLIDICLANDPKDRPPFTYIVETLQKLIENSTSIYL